MNGSERRYMKHRDGGVIVSVSGGCHGGVGLVFIERDGPFNHAVDCSGAQLFLPLIM